MVSCSRSIVMSAIATRTTASSPVECRKVPRICYFQYRAGRPSMSGSLNSEPRPRAESSKPLGPSARYAEHCLSISASELVERQHRPGHCRPRLHNTAEGCPLSSLVPRSPPPFSAPQSGPGSCGCAIVRRTSPSHDPTQSGKSSASAPTDAGFSGDRACGTPFPMSHMRKTCLRHDDHDNILSPCGSRMTRTKHVPQILVFCRIPTSALW